MARTLYILIVYITRFRKIIHCIPYSKAAPQKIEIVVTEQVVVALDILGRQLLVDSFYCRG